MNAQILRAILRANFSSFIHKTFDTINPGITYNHNWHIDLIAEYLENVRKGQIKRLIINMPPRTLKSICVSVAWPAWILGQDPTKRILVASYSNVLGVKHSMDCRFVMNAKWYQRTFVNTILSKKQNQKSKFMTSSYGFRFATSVGGSVTGEGGDILIIDDPHNPTHIHSPKMRHKAIDWFENTFSSRLNDRSNGAIVIVMQRLHEDDLCGYLTNAQNSWEVLKIPAMWRDNKMFTVNGHEIYFSAGDTLSVSRHDKAVLAQVENEIGAHNFAAQYMQEPISANTAMISERDITTQNALPCNVESYIMSWDTAIKTSDNSDYSVCTVWGITRSNYYLVDLIRKRMTYPELKASAQRIIAKYNPKLILIEDKASGQSLIQDLRADGVHNILPQNPKLDKITRFASVVDMIQSGMVIIPSQVSWYKELIAEITSFPWSKNDDIVDSISQFLNHMKYYKREVKVRELR